MVDNFVEELQRRGVARFITGPVMLGYIAAFYALLPSWFTLLLLLFYAIWTFKVHVAGLRLFPKVTIAALLAGFVIGASVISIGRLQIMWALLGAVGLIVGLMLLGYAGLTLYEEVVIRGRRV